MTAATPLAPDARPQSASLWSDAAIAFAEKEAPAAALAGFDTPPPPDPCPYRVVVLCRDLRTPAITSEFATWAMVLERYRAFPPARVRVSRCDGTELTAAEREAVGSCDRLPT